MRFIPTRIHGVMDYLVGILLIATPWLFDFAAAGTEAGSNIGRAAWVAIIIGFGTLCYSLITDYEVGLIPLLSVRAHLWIDGLAGVFLIVSPWLAQFAPEVWIPHVVIGIFEVIAALTTYRTPAVQSTSHQI